MADLGTREQILGSAEALFLEQGAEATSMEQVRQRAGVSNGSLYHHFPTKAQLARALYAATLAHFHAAMRKAIGDDVSAEVGVRALVQAHIGWVVKHPARARVLHELRRTTAIADAEADWAALNAEVLAELKGWVQAQQAAGGLLPMPFAVWMALVFAPVLQLTPGWAREQRPVPPKLRALLANAAWASVAPW